MHCEADPDNADNKRIEALLRRLEDEHGFSGTVALLQDRELAFQGSYGLANRELRTPNAADTIFRIGSLTKSFTAAVVLALAAENRLPLHDPTGDHLADCPPQWADLTVHHLLTHTSGIPDFGDIPDLDVTAMLPATHADLVDRIRQEPLRFRPGERWAYSSAGYIVLGALVEQVTGRAYEQVLKERILEPLRMHRTGCCIVDDDPDRAIGYTRVGEALERAPVVDLSRCPAAGGLCSTANDLVRWCLDLLAGHGSPSHTLRSMAEPSVAVNADGTEHYGYGWAIRSLAGRRLVYHDGRLPGFRCCLSAIPDLGAAIVVLSNDDRTRPCAIVTEIGSAAQLG